MSVLKEAWEFYKKRKEEERQKETVLSSTANFAFLESLIRKCNNNPQLRITLILKDGTKVVLNTYEAPAYNTEYSGSKVEEYSYGNKR